MIYLLWFLGLLLLLSAFSFVFYLFYFQEISRLEKIAREYPGYADVRIKLGRVFKDRHDYDKAIKYFTEALRIYPYYLEAYKELFYIYDSKGETAQSREILEKLLEFAKNQQDNEMIKFAEKNLSLR